MTRLTLSIAFLLLFNVTFGQSSKDKTKHIIPSKIIKGDSVKLIIDSLKKLVLTDTVKFNSKDLININGRTENKNSYSLLFYVDLKYFYRLDIINGTMVSEFANEILNASKIESINILDKEESMLIFGLVGNNGGIILSTKPKTRLNYKVGGLDYNKKRKTGNNFLQLPKDGTYIMFRT
jgi:hypothetical protein